MFKVIVTGATGFIGRRLCKALLDKGICVYGIGRNNEVLRELEENDRFHGFSLEFADYSQIENLITDRDFDYFFHLANYGVNGADKENYKIQIQNIKIACDCVEIANTLGCKRFIFVGSVDEFEAVNLPDANYRTPTHSKIYGTSKYAAEQIGKVLAGKFDIEYVSALLTLTYGENNTTNILPNVIIKNSINKEPIKLIEGNNSFDIIYVEEAIEGILAIAEKGHNMESYYVGHEQIKTFKQIVEEINNSLKNPIELQFGCYKDKGMTIDFSLINRKKLFEDTGYKCNLEIKDCIQKTYDWFISRF